MCRFDWTRRSRGSLRSPSYLSARSAIVMAERHRHPYTTQARKLPRTRQDTARSNEGRQPVRHSTRPTTSSAHRPPTPGSPPRR
jgi:hypothetical protein